MKDKKKYRIIKVTLGDKTSWFEVQKKSWFNKWNTCEMFSVKIMANVPAMFNKLQDAERFISRNFVAPIVQVVKEV